jgi:transcription factor C subunit 3
MWQWLIDHPDIRIVYQKEVRRYTLSEFEAAEIHETGTLGEPSSTGFGQSTDASTNGIAHPSKALSVLGGALRQRLAEEGETSGHLTVQDYHVPEMKSLRQSPRNSPEAARFTPSTMPNFDEPDPSITTPRLYASQNRIWQALTGHSIDLKKVPSMEFVLLSLIAAQGAEGITQPELTALSGQDKRSVPHRTNELERKNYITKVTVQSYKLRTSLLIHKRFVSRNHSLESSTVDNVYQKDLFVVRAFPQLLYNTLGKAGIVPTRNLRNKLVSIFISSTWLRLTHVY